MEHMELLRIYVNTTDLLGGQPLYELIAERARTRGIAGVTVLRGIMGFGQDREIHRAKSIAFADKRPVVIEIADDQGKIEAFLLELNSFMKSGLVVIQQVEPSLSHSDERDL